MELTSNLRIIYGSKTNKNKVVGILTEKECITVFHYVCLYPLTLRTQLLYRLLPLSFQEQFKNNLMQGSSFNKT